jgi:thioesterase domain-containing protein
MSRNDFTPVGLTGHPLIVPFRADGSGPPLFCLPGAGGSVYIFDEMTAALPPGHPVYVIDMESLCDADREFTVEELAPLYLEAVKTIQGRGPYYLCGYSFGGLVAYEMAVRLLEEGDAANLVGLLDAANPAMLSNLSQAEAANFHKTYLMDRLKRYGRNLLRGDIKAFAGRGSAFIVARLGKFFTPPIKSAFRILRRPLPRVFRANDPIFLKAWSSYVPRRYAGSLVIFRVEDRGPEYDNDPSMGWSACVSGGVQVHIVPGGHVDMMSQPSVRVVAETLATYLDADPNRD